MYLVSRAARPAARGGLGTPIRSLAGEGPVENYMPVSGSLVNKIPTPYLPVTVFSVNEAAAPTSTTGASASAPAPVVSPAPMLPAPIATPAAPGSQPTVTQATTVAGNGVSTPAPPPGGYPTNQTYTDAAGNVWSWSATAGWQITSPAASSITTSLGLENWISSIGAWLTSETLVSFLPNYATLGIGGAALAIAMKMLGGRRHRR